MLRGQGCTPGKVRMAQRAESSMALSVQSSRSNLTAWPAFSSKRLSVGLKSMVHILTAPAIAEIDSFR